MDIKMYKVKLAGGGYVWNYGNGEEGSAKALLECAQRKAELDAVDWPTCTVDPESPNYYHFTREETQVVSRDRYVVLLEAGLKLELEQVIYVNVDPAEVFQRVSEAYSKGLEMPSAGATLTTTNVKCTCRATCWPRTTKSSCWKTVAPTYCRLLYLRAGAS